MKLFFQKLGDGPALLILHGLYGASDNWLSIARKLAMRNTVYLIDLRNHGRSPHDYVHNYEVMAADVVELMDDERLNKAILLGHSMGGKTAMLLAAKYPERIEKLIVVDIAPFGYARVDEYSGHSVFHLNILNAMLSLDFANYQSRSDIETELAKTIRDTPVRQFIMKNVHRNSDNSFAWKINVPVLSKSLPSILGDLHLEKIASKKDMPVLFIRGENSDYILPEQEAPIRQIFPRAQFITIANAGHWVHAEQPQLFQEAIEQFID